MNNKQRVFVEEYLSCWNGAEAARKADYKHPRQQAVRLLSDINIQEEIQKRLQEKCLSADEVLVRLGEQARSLSKEYIDDFGFVNFKKLKADGLIHLVKKIKRNQQGIEVELYDAQMALVHIGRHHKLFTDKIEGNVDTRVIVPGLDVILDKVYGDSED